MPRKTTTDIPVKTQWEDAPESITCLAQEIIDDHHPHLIGKPIRYAIKTASAKDGAKPSIGAVHKIAGLGSYLAGENRTFFVVEIHGDAFANLSDRQQRRALDEQLCKLGVSDKGKMFIKHYDVQGFIHIAARYGLEDGSDELQFVKAAVKGTGGQMQLPLEGEAA